MAESRVIVNRPNSSSPPPNCAICLGTCTNKCFSDSCMHQFCFKCLLEWSKIKAECPLCKQPFRRIIHNVKSNEEYDEHVVEITPPEEIHIIDNEEFLVLPLTPSSHTRHQFHFRTTFTVDTLGEHAIQQMLLTHPLTNGGQISVQGYAPGRAMYHRRRRDNTSTSFRRSIYTGHLWVNAPPDVTGRYRDVSPSFFRRCPGSRTRLAPWLNRELNALLYDNTQLVMRVVDMIMEQLLRYHICSRTFRNLLYEYLDNRTDHFVHEFYNFMRSPFDMIGYDRHVIYSERPQSPTPYLDLSDNDNDSDVIIVGTTNPEEPVVIDLVNTDSDEPILVSQVPMPIRESCSETERRSPLLPLKLRLKHKRQTREKEKEKKLRQKRKPRRHRSRSSSTSSSMSRSSSSSSDSSKDSYKRYKRRRKHKKSTKKREHSRSSESDLNVEDTESEFDDNLPLSTFASKKRHMKKLKKRDCNYKMSKHNNYLSVSSSTKDQPRKEPDRIPQVNREEESNLPSCSRYSSDSSSSRRSRHSDKRSREKSDENDQNRGCSSGSTTAPTCSRYAYSPYTSSQDGTNSSNLNVTRSDDTSNEEGYPLKHLVKSEVREVRPEEKTGGPSGTSGGNNGRLRNILIKKEGSSNMWYSYPCNYDTDSSEN